MNEYAIRLLFKLAVRLGRSFRTEYIQAMLWSALRDDGRGTTDEAGFERGQMDE